MRILICAISRDARWAVLKQEQEQLIPEDIRRNKKIIANEPLFHFEYLDPGEGKVYLPNYFYRATEYMDAVLVLAEQTVAQCVADIAPSLFICKFEEISFNSQFRNVVSGLLRRGLLNLFFVVESMASSDNEQALSLPIRNFIAEELTRLVELCREEGVSPEFPDKVGPLLRKLKQRRKPRRTSNRPEKHFHDDEERMFRFGYEQHSKLESKTPHTRACLMNGNFRFGKRIDASRHFNVTDDVKGQSKISGRFVNCHDVLEDVAATTHLNMFANDFFGGTK
ncbi:hypothetical protein [Luteibacter sahnii]|uniref:hypothetical protein n=1 Tax=Luteibacter sahnii TaxID=3021977 RepID=UPI002A6A7141|nr:hypothetical protein [Luteibacter sp. PPL193]MDY1548548.1 hypothetical protein [Luteibacter sp. PPL193]